MTIIKIKGFSRIKNLKEEKKKNFLVNCLFITEAKIFRLRKIVLILSLLLPLKRIKEKKIILIEMKEMERIFLLE